MYSFYDFTFFPAVALVFAAAYAVGALGQLILLALRRSGTQRLSPIHDSPG